MHPAEAGEDCSLGELVAGAAGQRQRLLVSDGCRRIVPGQRLQVAQTVEGMGLAGLIAQVAVERRSPGEAGANSVETPSAFAKVQMSKCWRDAGGEFSNSWISPHTTRLRSCAQTPALSALARPFCMQQMTSVRVPPWLS